MHLRLTIFVARSENSSARVVGVEWQARHTFRFILFFAKLVLHFKQLSLGIDLHGSVLSKRRRWRQARGT